MDKMFSFIKKHHEVIIVGLVTSLGASIGGNYGYYYMCKRLQNENTTMLELAKSMTKLIEDVVDPTNPEHLVALNKYHIDLSFLMQMFGDEID